MTTHLVVAVDVFADSDPEHPCASVRRVGGGKYRVVHIGEDIDVDGVRIRHDFDTIEEAAKFADDLALLVEADPRLSNAASVQANAEAVAAKESLAALQRATDAERTTKDARIAQLEAQLAAATKGGGEIIPVDTPVDTRTRA